MARRNRVALAVALFVSHGSAIFADTSSTVNILTANYDNERTNANLKETILNPSNVAPGTFGKIGSFPVDGQIYAQPLYAAGVQIAGKGIRNVVFTATMHNSVYAIDADDPASIAPLWQVNLGRAVPSSVLDFTDILPEVGILSTPVIDLAKQVIYVVTDTLESDVPVFQMHALSLADGHEVLNGPVAIKASVPGIGAGAEQGMLAFDAAAQLQRPGLALVNGTVFAAFGSHGDMGNFHGWLIGYDASDLRHMVTALSTSPNTFGASIWQAGRAPVIDPAGNIIVVTGNGYFTGDRDFGDSVLKLAGRDLSLLDWFTPDNWSALNDDDKDLGSAGAILIPGTNQLLTAGKSGDLILLDATSLGHLGPMNSKSVQSFRATPKEIFDFALWNQPNSAVAYVQEPFGPLMAYRINAGRFDPVPVSQTPATFSLYAGLAVSADGTTSATAIVWQTTANFNTRQYPGTLHAYEATDLSHELWNSDMSVGRDTLGRYAKFVAPTVVNGRVYVPTFSGQLAIYGLLSNASPGSSDVKISSIANAASLMGSAVAPNEVVALYGTNLGPSAQVLFNGVSAPVLYSSINEVDAVVPSRINGPAAQVQVVNEGQWSTTFPIPIVPADPALFAEDGTGGGPGSILNADGTVNCPDNPASPGSVIVLLATGIGATTPAGEDGQVTDEATPLVPVLRLTVDLDGIPAGILAITTAPGMVQGFVQIKVNIPETLPLSYDVHVRLRVGAYSSPTTVTLAVQ